MAKNYKFYANCITEFITFANRCKYIKKYKIRLLMGEQRCLGYVNDRGGI